ncbi:MAG: hypothetical protein PVF40_01325 [Ectothiorhodospiraceae bacterium]
MAILVALLAGCQLLPVRENDQQQSAAASQAAARDREQEAQARRLADVVSFYRQTADMEEEGLQRRLSVIESDVQPGRCNAARLKSAMLIARLGPRRDVDTDSEYLAPCTKDPLARYSAEGSLAILVQDLINAHSARASSEAKLKDAAAELKKLRGENAELSKQLEGLKAIERSIQKRDRRQPAEE